MILNKRQIRCLAALATSNGHLEQLDRQTAAWHVHSGSLKNPVRLSLTGGDVWALTKAGLISKYDNERRFCLDKVEVEHPVESNIAAIRRREEGSFRGLRHAA